MLQPVEQSERRNDNDRPTTAPNLASPHHSKPMQALTTLGARPSLRWQRTSWRLLMVRCWNKRSDSKLWQPSRVMELRRVRKDEASSIPTSTRPAASRLSGLPLQIMDHLFAVNAELPIFQNNFYLISWSSNETGSSKVNDSLINL